MPIKCGWEVLRRLKPLKAKGIWWLTLICFRGRLWVGHFDKHMRSDLVKMAPKLALWHRKPSKGLMVHTHQGRQFISDNYLTLLKSWSLKPSMSRRGNCWDNAVIESFFKTLKTEKIYQLPKLPTQQEMLWQVQEFIGKRPHSKNDYLASAKFEKLHRERAETEANNLGTKKC